MGLTYSTLIADKNTAGSIKRFVNYEKLDVEQIVLEAQALLCQTLRVREMRFEFPDLILAAGDSAKTLPVGWLDPIELKDKTNNINLRLFPESNIIKRRTYENGTLLRSIPFRYAVFGEHFQFECAYDLPAIIHCVGYKRPDELSPSNESNFLTDRYPHLLRVACQTQAYDFMSNSAKYQSSLTMLSALIEKTNAESDMSYRGLEIETEVY